MRTNGARLSLLFLSSACAGRVFADGIAGGGAGGSAPPQDRTRIQNQHAQPEAQPSARVLQDDDSPTPPIGHYESATAATNTHADTDATCSAADGSSCSTAAAAAAATTTTTTTTTSNDQEDEPSRKGEEEGAVPVQVETGEHGGVRIEFVGRAEGKIPEPERSASSSPARGASAAGQLPAAAAAETMKFELLRCDGDSHGDATEGAGLTVKGIWNHLRGKLESSWEESAQWIAPKADAAPGKGAAARTVGRAVGSGTDGTGSSGGGSSGLGQALALAIAPASYLCGVLGGMPGWFSDVVFEVGRKDEGSATVYLQDHLVLVQNRSRFTELACSIVAPFTLPPPTAAAAAGSASSAPSPIAAAGMRLLPRIVRNLCSSDAPFPGKVVSRPCLDASLSAATTAQQQQQQQAQGWFSTFVGDLLSGMGFGGGAPAGVSGESGGVCVCLDTGGGGGGGGYGGASKCTIRAPPGRDPCLYVEVTGGSRGKKGGGGSSGFAAESVATSSSVELRTYNYTFASAAPAPEGGGGLAALHAAAVERGLLPSTVAVPGYAAMLVTGVVLLLLSQPLSESRVFHYLLSVLLGPVFLAAALVLPVVRNPRRSFLRLLLVSGLVTWLVVAAGVDLVPSPAALLAQLPTAVMAFWSDGFTSYPWAGKASLAAAGLAGVVITRLQGLFLEEEDGYRGSGSSGQVSIRRVLRFYGIFMVYHGVSDSDVGVALVLLSLAAPTLAHYVKRYNMWSNSSKWYRAGNKLSQEEYEAQGDEYTRQAIAALRESAGEEWSVVKKLKNQRSRKRMTLFVQSGQHYVDRAEQEDAGNGWTCTVQ